MVDGGSGISGQGIVGVGEVGVYRNKLPLVSSSWAGRACVVFLHWMFWGGGGGRVG